MEYRNRVLTLTLDGQETRYTLSDGDGILDLDSSIYLGGGGGRLPWHLWTREGKFFKGCLWGVRFNGGDVIDLESAVSRQRITGIDTGCNSPPVECGRRPCANAGVCGERFTGGPVCDCSDTDYTGRNCQTSWCSVFFEYYWGSALRAPFTTVFVKLVQFST